MRSLLEHFEWHLTMFAAIRSALHDLARKISITFDGRRKSDMSHNGALIVRSWRIGTDPGDFPAPRELPLPLLTHLDELEATEWVEGLKIFGTSIAAFLPGHFAAYARVYHPFELSGRDERTASFSRWRDLPEFASVDIGDELEIGDVSRGVGGAHTSVGMVPLSIIDVLNEHLGPATTTPDECYFAVWSGFGGLAAAHDLQPQLELPDREYHVFTGPLAASRTSYDAYTWGSHQHYANLWWPADHAWCVATEIDHPCTYVGGSRECIDAVLADPRLESMETFAHARW